VKTLSLGLRCTATLVLVAVCLFLCGGFWFTTSEWNPEIFGRYSVKWFIGALTANALIILCTWGCLRFVWSGSRVPTMRHSSYDTASGLSPGKRLLFSGAIIVPVLLCVEAVLQYYDVAPAEPGKALVAGIERNFHASLQQVDRVKRDGKWLRAYHGRVHDLAKTSDFRVVCLGGSTTWGHRLDLEDTWPAILEEVLRAEGYDAEVINAGRPYHTTAQSLTNYSLQMRHYDPDVVVIMHGINDLARSFPQPGEPGIELDYGSYQGPMRRVLDVFQRSINPSFWERVQLLDPPAIYRLICQQTALDRKFYGDLRHEAKVVEVPGIDVGLDAFPTIASFRSNLEYLLRLCRADGRRVLLATQAHVYEREDFDALDHALETTRKTLLVNADGIPVSRRSVQLAMQAIRETTLDIAAQFSVPVADVERAVNAQLEYFMDDFHPNPRGSTLAAHAVFDGLRPILDDLQTLHARRDVGAVATTQH
jgi:lysophospholipase L1-like esterase